MRHLLSALVMIILIGISAKAEEVTFAFAGVIHELDTEFYHFGGRPFEITYSFERTTRDANPGEPESGKYIGAIKSGGLTVFADNKTYHWAIQPDGPNNLIEVKHLKNSDSYSAGASISGQGSANEVAATFIIELTDDSATALGNDALPSSLKLMSFGTQKIVRFTFMGASQRIFYAFGIIYEHPYSTILL
jgi:hypothetical protein